MLTKETVSALVEGQLSENRIAVILDHDFGRDPLPDNLRAVLKQAGADVISSTTITRDFITLPTDVRRKVARSLTLYPPPGVHFRTLIAQRIADDVVAGRSELIRDLHGSGLLRSGADSTYTVPPDAVLMVGGLSSPSEASPERIDLPMIERLSESGVRVVGCEAREVEVSSISTYKAAGISTVDNADTPAGRLSVVLTLAGADGHFGVKDTADSFLPPVLTAGER
jgi:hypothetical protein